MNTRIIPQLRDFQAKNASRQNIRYDTPSELQVRLCGGAAIEIWYFNIYP